MVSVLLQDNIILSKLVDINAVAVAVVLVVLLNSQTDSVRVLAGRRIVSNDLTRREVHWVQRLVLTELQASTRTRRTYKNVVVGLILDQILVVDGHYIRVNKLLRSHLDGNIVDELMTSTIGDLQYYTLFKKNTLIWLSIPIAVKVTGSERDPSTHSILVGDLHTIHGELDLVLLVVGVCITE